MILRAASLMCMSHLAARTRSSRCRDSASSQRTALFFSSVGSETLVSRLAILYTPSTDCTVLTEVYAVNPTIGKVRRDIGRVVRLVLLGERRAGGAALCESGRKAGRDEPRAGQMAASD